MELFTKRVSCYHSSNASQAKREITSFAKSIWESAAAIFEQEHSSTKLSEQVSTGLT